MKRQDALINGVRYAAALSDCGRYRVWLRRQWGPPEAGNGAAGADVPGAGVALFLMLNPSTADHKRDDPTLRRCIGFARGWGLPGLEVRNLFDLRATDPRELRHDPQPLSLDGLDAVKAVPLLLDTYAVVVAAWGRDGSLFGRADQVLNHLRDVPLFHLGLNADGSPMHPLYRPKTTALQPLNEAARRCGVPQLNPPSPQGDSLWKK